MKMKVHYDFNDILITPAVTSSIKSRSEINPYYINWLPIIVSPMDTVIDTNNWKKFLNEKMTICFPRGITPESFKGDDKSIISCFKDVIFFSYSLEQASEITKWLLENPRKDLEYNILIDIANGHMQQLVDIVKELKKRTKIKVMVGNIANPETYRVLSEAGADYIRVGIGFGGGCLTAMNTGVGYSMASLIEQCAYIKNELISEDKKFAKIIGDGGFREYSDIIKALALGADYVMLGSILNKTLESAGETYWSNCLFTINLTNFRVPQSVINFLWKKKAHLEKKFRGMSTKEVQKKWGKKKLTTSEGVVRMRTVKYTLSGWRENFEDYLKSAMSYTNSRTLNEFIGKVNWTIISQNSFGRFNK
jgi:IMP dehydrogenase/GMP reductase